MLALVQRVRRAKVVIAGSTQALPEPQREVHALGMKLDM